MNTNDLVTVIIPNYNHAPYLEERILSVVNQTYKNIEIIILDDCSQDNGASKAIIEKYKNLPVVKDIIYNNENSGSVFKQWYNGIMRASGNLIWIAESDDSCSKEFLERVVKKFRENINCSFVYANSVTINEYGTINMLKNRKDFNGVISGKKFIKKYMLSGNHIYNASSTVFKASNAIKLGDEYTSYKGAGDYFFWIKMAEFGDVVHIDEILNYNRRHSENLTKKLLSNGNNFKELRRIYEYLCENHNLSFIEKIYSLSSYLYYAYSIGFKDNLVKNNIINILRPNIIVRIFVKFKLFAKKYC